MPKCEQLFKSEQSKVWDHSSVLPFSSVAANEAYLFTNPQRKLALVKVQQLKYNEYNSHLYFFLIVPELENKLRTSLATRASLVM